MKHRKHTPNKQNHNHHGRDLHHLQCLVARLFDALGVLPPEVDGDQSCNRSRGAIHRKLAGRPIRMHRQPAHPVMRHAQPHQLVHQSDDVLPGRHPGDRPRQNVVEHQRRDAELGERPAQRLLDDPVDAAARKHAAAFDIDRSHREAEQHHAQDEPRRGLAHGLFGDAARIEGRGPKVVQHNRRRSPERNEGEHDRRGHDQADAVRLRLGR